MEKRYNGITRNNIKNSQIGLVKSLQNVIGLMNIERDFLKIFLLAV